MGSIPSWVRTSASLIFLIGSALSNGYPGPQRELEEGEMPVMISAPAEQVAPQIPNYPQNYYWAPGSRPAKKALGESVLRIMKKTSGPEEVAYPYEAIRIMKKSPSSKRSKPRDPREIQDSLRIMKKNSPAETFRDDLRIMKKSLYQGLRSVDALLAAGGGNRNFLQRPETRSGTGAWNSDLRIL